MNLKEFESELKCKPGHSMRTFDTSDWTFRGAEIIHERAYRSALFQQGRRHRAITPAMLANAVTAPSDCVYWVGCYSDKAMADTDAKIAVGHSVPEFYSDEHWFVSTRSMDGAIKLAFELLKRQGTI